MSRIVVSALAVVALLLPLQPVHAHQPVSLLTTDTTPQKGPLLVDGTVSFAIRASFNKSGEKRGFRAALKAGDTLAVQYLIVDKRPENRLKNSQLPQLVITSPSGKNTSITFTERTPFFEPFGRTNYLYLSRYKAPAEAGIYNFTVTGRGKAAITIAVGEKEIPGEVVRGQFTPSPSASPTPSQAPSSKPTPSAASPTPSATATVQAGYTMDQVRANNSPSKCWVAIKGNVYDLTQWIASHPGGSSPIRSLCGTDGTSAFTNQHGGQGSPQRNLDTFLLGPLAK